MFKIKEHEIPAAFHYCRPDPKLMLPVVVSILEGKRQVFEKNRGERKYLPCNNQIIFYKSVSIEKGSVDTIHL